MYLLLRAVQLSNVTKAYAQSTCKLSYFEAADLSAKFAKFCTIQKFRYSTILYLLISVLTTISISDQFSLLVKVVTFVGAILYHILWIVGKDREDYK